MRRTFSTLLASALTLTLASSAMAAVFPDVPAGHLYEKPIDALVNAGVITGNPDGTFAPDRVLNRAELLKMLYKATGKTPDSSSRACFTDVERLSWYESYVCDAAARHYVDGYGDRTFRPNASVNRVEAVKMILTVFEIPVTEVGESAKQVVKFVDVSTSAWYTKYLYTAYVTGVLPIAGQDTGRLYPEWPLLRGEAAAMIWNGINAKMKSDRGESNSSVAAASVASVQAASSASSVSSVPVRSVASSARSSSSAPQMSFDVPFPFESGGKFYEKKSMSYLFSLGAPAVVAITTNLQSGQPGSLTCRLYAYKSGTEFSYEYYIGFVEGSTCTVKAALDAGDFQFQVQPTVASTTYAVKGIGTSGDGNDGFREAPVLPRMLARTGVLEASDFADFYKFVLSSPTTLDVTASQAADLTCAVYPMEDVKLDSFSNPACNQRFQYPAGTYYIAIGRKSPAGSKQTYTLVVQ